MTNTTSPLKIPDVVLSSMTVDQIENLFERCFNRAMQSIEKKSSEDEILTLDEACEFLNLQRATIYGMTSRREIPFLKRSKKLYFSKSDLTAWLKSSSRKIKAA